MPEDVSKANKIAAARRKLKEYQKRGSDGTAAINVGEEAPPTPAQSSHTGSVSSNISERSESDLNLNGVVGNESGMAVGLVQVENISEAGLSQFENVPSVGFQQFENVPAVGSQFENMPTNSSMTAINFYTPPSGLNTAANYFNATVPIQEQSVNSSVAIPFFGIQNDSQQNLNTIQVLIAEKAQQTTELNKYRAICREKDLELEELRTQFNSTTQRLEELQERFVTQQQSAEHLRNKNAELQHKLSLQNADHEDKESHLAELKKQLIKVEAHCTELENDLKERSNELEMAQIRIRQLSDESNISNDNRVETLTQTQFMYEQQIRDLQAMVQQLNQDKEQSSLQFQNYVQHLNSEIVNLNEKNAELMDESAKLQDRERQLIDHISELEREIQKNISLQKELLLKEEKGEVPPATNSNGQSGEIDKLNEKLNDFELERHEFQLKIKSQEDRLENLNMELQKKQNEIEQLQERLEQVSDVQPDTTKLLATMESDKVAASRAVTQNIELKKQLDELELRFVQLTNDKAELMNKLDSEEYANREVRNNYAALEQRLQAIDERYKFKDEEMIRLSHENMELTHKNLLLQQQNDRLQHFEVNYYNANYGKVEQDGHENENQQYVRQMHQHDHGTNHPHGQPNAHTYDEQHDEQHVHQHDHEQDLTPNHYHLHEFDNVPNNDRHNECEHDNPMATSLTDYCVEATEDHLAVHTHENCDHHHNHNEHSFAFQNRRNSTQLHIATEEAVAKLEQRFTQLISQVADLTDEKQRLEHLVLQLQGETETIGEYVTLYQTQRRMLKQREYEKAAQMQLLQAEREQLHEKITLLNNLVSSLGVELPPNNQQLKMQANAALAEGVSIEANSKAEETLNVDDAQQQQQKQQELTQENLQPQPQQQQQQELKPISLQDKLNSSESQQIINKIQNILTEIKENTKELPNNAAMTGHSVDHLSCCLGKFEVV